LKELILPADEKVVWWAAEPVWLLWWRQHSAVMPSLLVVTAMQQNWSLLH